MDEGEPGEASNEHEPSKPASGEGPQGPPDGERRGAIRALITLGGLAWAGALTVPAAAFLAPPAGEGAGRERWIRVGRLADVPKDEPKRLQVTGDALDAFTLTRGERLGSIWVLRSGDGVRALASTCPHLGCAIDLGADKKSFACPCHASRFALSGEPESGPSPRAMDPLAARVVDGFIEVDFRRYRQGITERREVSA